MEDHKTGNRPYSRSPGETIYKLPSEDIVRIYPQMSALDTRLAVVSAFRDIVAILVHMKLPQPEYVGWSSVSDGTEIEINMIWPCGDSYYANPHIRINALHGLEEDAMIGWIHGNDAPLAIHSYPKQLEMDTLPRLLSSLSPK